MAKSKKKSPGKGSRKTVASGRTANPPNPRHRGQQPLNATAAFQDHDARNRLGGFEQQGEHARTGNRGHQ